MSEQTMVECPACGGDGITEDDDFEDCPTCDGEGKVNPEQQHLN